MQQNVTDVKQLESTALFFLYGDSKPTAHAIGPEDSVSSQM